MIASKSCASTAAPGKAPAGPRAVASTPAADGAQVYAAGVLISPAGYGVDSALLQGYAATHSMLVLMANHGGATGGWESAGRSAVWTADGALLAAAPGVGDGLLIARREVHGWSAAWHSAGDV